MSFPVTQKMLIDWGGPQVLKDAQSLIDKGLILEAVYEPPFIRGALLWNNRQFNTAVKLLPDGTVESQCPCWANKERGTICAHVIAIALSLVKRNTDPQREAKYKEEVRRASKLATVNEAEYIQRVITDDPKATPAALQLVLPGNWLAQFESGTIQVASTLTYSNKTVPLDDVPRNVLFRLSKQDESLLFVLEDISTGPAKGVIDCSRSDFLNLLHISIGRHFLWEGHPDLTVNEPKMTTFLRLDLDQVSGELRLHPHTELPFMQPGETPIYLVAGGRSGWVYGAGNLWPMESLLPLPYHPLYSQETTIPRAGVMAFMQQELPAIAKSTRIESDISVDLFTFEPATPKFRLLIQGSPVALAATLFAKYGDIELVANKPDSKAKFGLPDPNDIMRYVVRNVEAEKQALAEVAGCGFSGECGDDLTHISGSRLVSNFLGGQLPLLRRRGWQIDLQGKVAPHFEEMTFVTPVVNIAEGGSAGWFDVSFDFETATGESLSASEIQTAIRKGDCHISKGGRTYLIDSDAVNSMLGTFSDCASSEGQDAGHFRLSDVYAPFVKSSLDALDGIDVEQSAAWRTRAEQFTRLSQVDRLDIKPELEQMLRPYQRDGVRWLRFLELNGFCGLLADEMGLGKTVQTIAWLSMTRSREQGRQKPALIVCPTSIVENWAEEIAKFAPSLRVLTLTGSDRHGMWQQVGGSDVIITSYALLRRDLEQYLQQELSVMILDEAQHIKNRSTQNAVAAKQIKAYHRLVLTGTPVENSVSDLWSIMDFLMPGYLGRHDYFRQDYEQPIQRGGPEAMVAQTRLKRKLQPFMLRRLKRDVAKDLPPKIQKVSFCALTADQRLVYTELLKTSKKQISDMVARQGFNKCRLQILATLMKLRQVCCHLDLLKLEGVKSRSPSGKLDMFLELLDEALDGGHRILVFSQFVSMLGILRAELDAAGTQYCYLDGATKDRMDVVHRFNTERSIPLFLISLKAGGTGLNLTGADMVVHFDPWWNPAVEDQATDRAYRIGQKKTVYSIKLITRNTVEEKVLALQEKKRGVINATVESDEAVMQNMTWEDMKDILDI